MGAVVTARIRAGLTQRDRAARLGRAHSFVGKVDSGERQLNVLEFCELADALKVSAAILLAIADHLLNQLTGKRFDWGRGSKLSPAELRASYIAALRAADGGDYAPLLAFLEIADAKQLVLSTQ